MSVAAIIAAIIAVQVSLISSVVAGEGGLAVYRLGGLPLSDKRGSSVYSPTDVGVTRFDLIVRGYFDHHVRRARGGGFSGALNQGGLKNPVIVHRPVDDTDGQKWTALPSTVWIHRYLGHGKLEFHLYPCSLVLGGQIREQIVLTVLRTFLIESTVKEVGKNFGEIFSSASHHRLKVDIDGWQNARVFQFHKAFYDKTVFIQSEPVSMLGHVGDENPRTLSVTRGACQGSGSGSAFSGHIQRVGGVVRQLGFQRVLLDRNPREGAGEYDNHPVRERSEWKALAALGFGSWGLLLGGFWLLRGYPNISRARSVASVCLWLGGWLGGFYALSRGLVLWGVLF